MTGPWYWLAEGSRVTAFAADQSPFVLKLLKTPESLAAQYRLWGINLGEVPWARAVGDEMKSARLMVEHSVRSYSLAAQLVPDLTGLAATHLLTGGPLPHAVIGGVSRNLAAVPFLLQWRVELVGSRINRLMSAGQPVAAREVIDDVIAHILTIWRRGTTENTFNFRDNYGYLPTGRMILVDIGELEWDKRRLQNSQGAAAARRIVKSRSCDWLKRDHPELVPYFLAQVEQHLAAWKAR
jgi:hypothetical protein